MLTDTLFIRRSENVEKADIKTWDSVSDHFLTLFILAFVFIFSRLSLYISDGTDKENLFDNQELLKSVIIPFILMTVILYSRVVL